MWNLETRCEIWEGKGRKKGKEERKQEERKEIQKVETNETVYEEEEF